MTTLSNRGYPMLRTFIDGGSGFHLSIDEAQHYDQRPFRSMLIRGWVVYKPGRGFVLTKEGANAWAEFISTDIGRKDPTAPLTGYFDPAAYGLAPRRPKQAKASPKSKPKQAKNNGGITLRGVQAEMRAGAIQ